MSSERVDHKQKNIINYMWCSSIFTSIPTGIASWSLYCLTHFDCCLYISHIMPVKIRLARLGRKGIPFYHIRVANARGPRDGKFIEDLGFYNPIPNKVDGIKEIKLNVDRTKYWLSVGAQPTEPILKLFSRVGLIPEYPQRPYMQSAKPKKQQENKEESEPKKTEGDKTLKE
ncbi:hypothetical protein WA158_000169 [Blastocystis sp. Blastoise]